MKERGQVHFFQEVSEPDPVLATQTVSIGAATLDPDENLAALVKRADEAMYAAKAPGRNRVVFANDQHVDGTG